MNKSSKFEIKTGPILPYTCMCWSHLLYPTPHPAALFQEYLPSLLHHTWDSPCISSPSLELQVLGYVT